MVWLSMWREIRPCMSELVVAPRIVGRERVCGACHGCIGWCRAPRLGLWWRWIGVMKATMEDLALLQRARGVPGRKERPGHRGTFREGTRCI